MSVSGTTGIAGAVLLSSMVTMGLIAGVFYAFSCSVMPGLARADDRTFVEAMQQINRAILNPVFAASFLGALVLTILAALLHQRMGQRQTTHWIVAAAVLYGITFLLTMAANVPLNEALNRAGNPSHISNLATVRQRFEVSWVRWNMIRAVLSTAALGCLGQALLLHGQSLASPSE